MDRRQFMGGALALGVNATIPENATRRPNVLYVIADEWRAQATGYVSDPNVHTPVLDRLARRKREFQTRLSRDFLCAARIAPV